MSNIMHKDQTAATNTHGEHKKFLGAAETTFIERYRNCMQDFKEKVILSVYNFSKYI